MRSHPIPPHPCLLVTGCRRKGYAMRWEFCPSAPAIRMYVRTAGQHNSNARGVSNQLLERQVKKNCIPDCLRVTRILCNYIKQFCAKDAGGRSVVGRRIPVLVSQQRLLAASTGGRIRGGVGQLICDLTGLVVTVAFTRVRT